ncbi:Fe(3+)-hydroxamate ABC transporter permease FhuB [Paraburkholderia domus]|jgi:ABC-type Fe3+-siderophore transport system, permease component|uniref:Fe(3+)-hydroxamate ABC transporter permease FhuB n=1 Tax=Paraburkholderia domus TaxID=2793075 RepID=UPI001B1F957D|nr:Fe(3+)-hydroxamate ABC transporter permease FhuB [Paraburkholderia domus]MBK5065684.1 Fe(3+)-hydroxamate ABC transporter permease FhuB [Burkholderia sp. R-70199]CAE6960791.1 Iron(3+)-hydroxamate import system permease protein FhuB [Paraburkholderia domus]
MTGRGWLARPGPLCILLALLAASLVAMLIRDPLLTLLARPATGGYLVGRMVLLYATLPRIAMAALCGAGLAAAGAIVQQVLRNPLASPTTLGVEAGARLALAIATIAAPYLLGVGRDLVALAGSAASTGLVFMLARRRDFQPVATVIAGLVIALFCGAFAALLVLVDARQMSAVFLWGGGSVSQQSWVPFKALALRLGGLFLLLLPLIRPLGLLDLGADGARTLGLPVKLLRVISIGIATGMTAFIVSMVGVIGFVGLVSPVLARLAGARRFGEQLVWSTVLGALILLIADTAIQILAGQVSEFLPTGAVTAVLGSPVLLVLLRQTKLAGQPSLAALAWRAPPRLLVRLVPLALVLLVVVSLLVGRGPAGDWSISSRAWEVVMTWRAPRLLASGAAGALLAVSGVVLQRVTRNELASAEVLGVSAGSLLAVALGLTIFGELGPLGEGAVAVGGGMLALVAVLAVGRQRGFAPDHMLLAGIAVSALADALVGALTTVDDPHAMRLLGWMSGSLAGVSLGVGVAAMLAALAALVIASTMSRWLEILPLGGEASSALGVDLPKARLSLLLLAAAASAAATPVLGPVTFIGLVAPHIVTTLGLRNVRSILAAAACTGAAIMIGADWVARTVTFPLQLPTGLVGALLGAPILVLLLNRKVRSQ